MRIVFGLLLAGSLSTPASAMPEGVVEVGAAAALGSAIGGALGGATVFLLFNNGFAVSRAVGLEGTTPILLVDYAGPPAVGAVAGAALGGFIASALRGHPASPAPVAAACGSLFVGGACAAPGFLGASQSFAEADQATTCSDACVSAATGLVFAGVGIASFCIGAPIGAGVGGGAGAAIVAPSEVPPALSSVKAPDDVPPPPPSESSTSAPAPAAELMPPEGDPTPLAPPAPL
jgi:hypothetical protein